MPANWKKISQIHRLHSSGVFGFGLVTYRPNGRLGLRWQTQYQLVVLHRGQVRVTLNGVEHLVKEGQGILLRPEVEESFQFTEDAETIHSWCQLSEAQIPPALAIPDEYCHVVADCRGHLLETMRAGWRHTQREPDPRAERFLIAEVLAAMWSFCRGLPMAEISPKPEALLRAERFMDENLGGGLTLDELARAAGVSKGHLILLARRHWRTTPMEHLWRQRLDRAARLLRETGLSIGEVADRTGFGNAFHFSRRFKQRFGPNPRAWREAQWSGRAHREEAGAAPD